MNEIMKFCPERIRNALEKIGKSDFIKIREIRLRTGLPICLNVAGRTAFCGAFGITESPNKAILPYPEEINAFFEKICRNSVYSFSEQIKNGYIPISGGHRVGLLGTAVISGGKVESVREISGFVIRTAHEIIGCCDGLYGRIFDGKNVKDTVIFAPPSGGKTTFLRDTARRLSLDGKSVCVIDERGELFAVSDGVAAFDTGFGLDILSGFPKAKGIQRALRTLSPQVIICDEIGTEDEASEITNALGCGVSVIISAHADTEQALRKRPAIAKLEQSGAEWQFLKITVPNG